MPFIHSFISFLHISVTSMSEDSRSSTFSRCSTPSNSNRFVGQPLSLNRVLFSNLQLLINYLSIVKLFETNTDLSDQWFFTGAVKLVN